MEFEHQNPDGTWEPYSKEQDALIADAWAQEPSERPAFEHIITRLQGLVDAAAATNSGRRGAERSPALSSAETSTAAGVSVQAGAHAAAAVAKRGLRDKAESSPVSPASGVVRHFARGIPRHQAPSSNCHPPRD